MSHTNLRKSSAQCEIVYDQPYHHARIEFYQDVCRVIDYDNYIKAECFAASGNRKFRVRIEIESVADDEVSRPQESIYVNGVFQYDPKCAHCQSNTAHPHDRHFYATTSGERPKDDYASCQHFWTTTSDGKTICRKCANIKLTRRTDAESYYSK